MFALAKAKLSELFCRTYLNYPNLTPGSEVIKLFFTLNSAEHEHFSANKYENANNS